MVRRLSMQGLVCTGMAGLLSFPAAASRSDRCMPQLLLLLAGLKNGPQHLKTSPCFSSTRAIDLNRSFQL